MKTFNLLTVFVLVCTSPMAQNKTLQEKLGYEKDAKLLIIHADDLGVAHSENQASIYALEKGVVNSASIMVPCPWFPEIAAYARKNPKADLGLHLTLNSEWNYYKWGPVASRQEVSSLLDSSGYFFDSVEKLNAAGNPEEAEKELRSQIEQALAFGIDPTHFDAHMGAAFSNRDFLEVYIHLGREYKVPVLLSREVLQAWYGIDVDELVTENEVLVDRLLGASPEDYDQGMKTYYVNALKSLQPGLNCLILHAAYDDEEMRAITVEHPYYHAKWRQEDFDFFTSKEAEKIIKDENIKLITWREIRDKLVRGKDVD